MHSWSQMVDIWAKAGAHYYAAVVRADEYERDHAAVDAKHAKILGDFMETVRAGEIASIRAALAPTAAKDEK